MIRLSLGTHPLAFLRGDLASEGFAPCADLKRTHSRRTHLGRRVCDNLKSGAPMRLKLHAE
jgi:hypothetical protein